MRTLISLPILGAALIIGSVAFSSVCATSGWRMLYYLVQTERERLACEVQGHQLHL
jgi:hypothetical protein